MPYTIRLAPAAVRELRKLPSSGRRRIAQHIEDLAQNPRPDGCKKLKGGVDFYRVRVGDLRIVYRVREAELIVLVVAIGHRRDIYDVIARLR